MKREFATARELHGGVFLVSAQTLFERTHSAPMGSDADIYDRILRGLRETVGDEHLEALATDERHRQENGTD